jgi:hypothetical protein
MLISSLHLPVLFFLFSYGTVTGTGTETLQIFSGRNPKSVQYGTSVDSWTASQEAQSIKKFSGLTRVEE